MNQTTATTIVNNKIWEIVLTRFKGLPVCYADNVEEYRMYIPIIERLNRGIVILCRFETTNEVESPNSILVEINDESSVVLAYILDILQPVSVLRWTSENAKKSQWNSVIEHIGLHCIDVNVEIDSIDEICQEINRILWHVDYEKNKSILGLNIGCGTNPISGWINVDLDYKYPQIAYMNAELPFPFPDNTFKYINSEHMFEHLSFQVGLHMLKEVYRILESGGKFILSVPTLDFLLQLYSEPESELHQRYMKWSIKQFDSLTDEFYSDEPLPAMFIVNNFMRFWGHRMIYDIKTLSKLLYRVGFCNVKCLDIGEFKLDDMALERHGDIIPAWANRLETKTFIAQKE